MEIITGCILAVFAGGMQGIFPLPMKYAKNWQWENIWSLFALWGFVILPWVLAFATVPNLLDVYGTASLKSIALVTLFGGGWGIGTICFGLGVSMLGLSLGFAIIIGLTGALGTLMPMLILHPEAFKTSGGLAISSGVFLLLVGVAICSCAGNMKEKALRRTDGNKNASGKKSVVLGKGLLLCLISGICSPMLNFAFVFGEEIIENAKTAGASPNCASNPIWCLAMSSAFVTTIIYSLWLMRKDSGWKRYVSPGTFRNWGLTFLMGFLWAGSIAVYAMSLSRLGLLAASIGWPILMISSIVTGNLSGIATGEWKGSGAKPLVTMIAGLLILTIAICIIGAGNS